MAKLAWKPWHKVVKLREDLKTGELPMHIFAADLYEVIMQRKERPVYEKPEEFFALTYPTFNLRALTRDVVHRLAGKNDKAVRQLALTYGGGKTHTLITLYHLANDPDNLPDLPSVKEFKSDIETDLPKARIAALCFDKLDVEKGMEVKAPDGSNRWLKQPWSVLAYQIDGDQGLKLLSASGKAEERDSAPAENLLMDLLKRPEKEGVSLLILIDEVLMYAREKAGIDRGAQSRLVNFFQYLTQAATKVNKCCIVASLLATDPKKSDRLGKEIEAELYDIFQRQREEIIEPVLKEDVAELLRRRFFTVESIKDREAFRPHVVTALKGIADVDEQTKRDGKTAEERYLRSFPFHPDLTEVFYAKWTSLERFQQTRGVLRTFALALREAEQWDDSPLIGANVFLNAPGKEGLCSATRELVTFADTSGVEGARQAWTAILEGELKMARDIQTDSVGLKSREIEQAVFTTFIHSQPLGRDGSLKDIKILLAAGRPDSIELDKGLIQWAQRSFWLDDRYISVQDSKVPNTWRLGNRPNLVQMHSVAMQKISDDIVEARLIDEINRTKNLIQGASASGARTHVLPSRPNDIEDDGDFHYAILGPSASSDSGKPSAESQRFIDETTSSDKPRVYRNAVVLVTPSKDGIVVSRNRIKEYLGWEQVLTDLKAQEGEVDAVRIQNLLMKLDKAKGKIPESIKQAYCIEVTVSDKNQVQAFKIQVADESLFTTIKKDNRSRIQESAITAEALLPGGPYDLWREGEDSRRVKDLAGAFAQLPHLPKMLKTEAIYNTLIDGCEKGMFVLQLRRPDRSLRTWWKVQSDLNSLKEPAAEVTLPEKAELTDLSEDLLRPGELPELWTSDQIQVSDVLAYFGGGKIVQTDRNGYKEPITIPKASKEAIYEAIRQAVIRGLIWMLSGPASLLEEEIPEGILTEQAVLREPPHAFAATEILPETLAEAWEDNHTTALSIATVLSNRYKAALPWKVVENVIDAAIRARFIQLDVDSATWPCDYSGAKQVKLVFEGVGAGTGGVGGEEQEEGSKVVTIELEPSQIQDLGDMIPALLEFKTQHNTDLKFTLSLCLNTSGEELNPEILKQINELLSGVDEDLKFDI